MITIYVYILDTLADWELGYATAELHSQRFFKKDAPTVQVKTVSYSRETITSMGGMTITPDCLVSEITMEESSVLLLPGATTWQEPQHQAILETAGELLKIGATVCGICGGTAALAGAGLLDERSHTSNGSGFLEMTCPNYQGTSHYVDEPAVVADNLITASSTGGLLWAKLILDRLAVFQPETLSAWYDYFRTGKPEFFYQLMGTLEN